MEQKAEIFLQDFYFKFSAETEIMPLSVDLYLKIGRDVYSIL